MPLWHLIRSCWAVSKVQYCNLKNYHLSLNLQSCITDTFRLKHISPSKRQLCHRVEGFNLTRLVIIDALINTLGDYPQRSRKKTFKYNSIPCDKIHRSIKNYLAKMFENDLIEGKFYVFSNFLIEESSGIYLPTTHVCRITFNKESCIVNTIDDRNIPDNHFNFLDHADILRQTNEKANLFDVIGLLTEKGELMSWSKAGKSGHYIVVDLHDLQSNVITLCVMHAKMGVSNTTYNSVLMINVDLEEVKKFRQRIMAIETGTPTRKTVCVTIGVVKDFSPGKSWWYKSCNVCPLAMREEGDGYKYSRCKAESQNFTPRYSLNLKVGDEESYASFIVYETIGSECLNISAAELRTKYIMRGGNRIDFPEELSKFKNKMFLFKVSVKLENINSFQLVSITVVKLCHNEAIINSFKQKYSIEQDAFFSINSNLITLPADYSDKNKDDREFIDAISEAGTWHSATFLRRHFVVLLISNNMSRPDFVWQKTWNFLSHDVLYEQRRLLQMKDLMMSEVQIKDIALAKIEDLLQSNGKSLKEYCGMSYPSENLVSSLEDRIIMEELNFDVNAVASELGGYLEKLTDEHKFAYDQIIGVWVDFSSYTVKVVEEKHSYGQLYHAQLGLKEDEAPMISKYCYKALDKCLRDILRCSDSYNAHLPFGGKVVVLGGDFRQILPMIPRGSRQDIIQSSINSSYLWHNCKVLKLTKNMRLSLQWLLKIGDGLAGDTTDGESIVHIPSDILVKNTETSLDDLIDFVYLDMLSNLSVENYFKDRAILAPTLDCVIDVNNKMTAGLPGQERDYLSSDSVCAEEENMEFLLDAFSPANLNGINCSGLPPHKLVVKVGAPIMLLRNIDQTNGL
ncbi:hypothetical protein Ahy_B10g104837 [Arachis hypogaea]|uniref:ATP-dependent DNA helicase n=1 Tax=Arachis hypogaea TaxID=3818 RepID=A0A444X6L9_ARAHY|nr:hypothetical protein Ahy_B10g104837 [Arachis hypogaea]